MNKKLLLGIGVAAAIIILAALLGKYIGYDIGYEQVARDLSQGETLENEFVEKTFSMKLPSGWKKVNEESVNENAPGDFNLLGYGDENGNYFHVYYDSGRFGDYGIGDSLWSLEKTPQDGIKVINEEEFCEVKNEIRNLYYCSPNDNRLDILGEGATGIFQVKDHAYYFRFGNETREDSANLAIFRNILASFRAR